LLKNYIKIDTTTYNKNAIKIYIPKNGKKKKKKRIKISGIE